MILFKNQIVDGQLGMFYDLLGMVFYFLYPVNWSSVNIYNGL